MAQISIQISGLDKLRKAFKVAPFQVKKEVNQGIGESLATLESTAKTLSPVDTGRLRSSHTTKQNFLRMTGELFPTVNYALFVHEGTNPHFPPLGNRGVGKWAKRRGIAPFLVGRAISQFGTPNQPWLTATANQDRRKVERKIQKSVNRALKKTFG